MGDKVDNLTVQVNLRKNLSLQNTMKYFGNWKHSFSYYL